MAAPDAGKTGDREDRMNANSCFCVVLIGFVSFLLVELSYVRCLSLRGNRCDKCACHLNLGVTIQYNLAYSTKRLDGIAADPAMCLATRRSVKTKLCVREVLS